MFESCDYVFLSLQCGRSTVCSCLDGGHYGGCVFFTMLRLLMDITRRYIDTAEYAGSFRRTHQLNSADQQPLPYCIWIRRLCPRPRSYLSTLICWFC